MGYSQFIKVHCVLYKDPITCAIDEETRTEDIVIDLCKRLEIKPVARHLFALCLHNSKEYLSPLIKLTKSESKIFDLRLRFKIPDILNLRSIDLVSYNFYYHQVRFDLLNNNVPDISCSKNEGELLGMGVADMYREMLETGASRDAVKSEYKKFIPRNVYKSHMFFLKQPMHKSLDRMMESCSKQGKHEVFYIKNQYLKQFEDLSPNYLCEDYKAFIEEEGVRKGITIQINPYDKEFPGIKFHYDNQNQWQHVCSIEDLCFITIRRDGSVEIARKTGIPIYFSFSAISSMFSFVSLLDGYYRLGVKWTFSLCKDLPTPSLERLKAMKCHGPVGGEFSYSKLEKLRSNKPGCYILRESELDYDQFYLDLCTENSAKPTTFKIEKSTTGEGWSFNSEEQRHTTIQELLVALKSPESSVKLNECLPPSEYDITPLLLCSVDKDSYDKNNDDETLTQLQSLVTQFIDPKELQLFKGHNKEFEGRISTVYRGVWYPEKRKKKKRKVDIALKVFKPDDHKIEEQLILMGQWASVQSLAVVRLFGLTLCNPRGFVMELLPLGPLDTYLSEQAGQVMEVDLVEAANYLATALWNLEEAGLVHGNIRCHKLLVAAHTKSSFVVRLTDPGLTRRYTDNEVHWLAPEYYTFKNNSVKSTESDVWAFGTTLWEMFSKGQHPSDKDIEGYRDHCRKGLKMMYLNAGRLKKPAGCSNDLYQLMQQCWMLDPAHRKKTQEIMRDVNRLLYQVFNSRRMHSYSVPMQKSQKCKPVALSDDPTIPSSLSTDSGSSMATDFPAECSFSSVDIHNMYPDWDLPTTTTSLDNVSSLQCIFELDNDCNVVLQGRIGQGFYGEVYRGYLEKVNMDCEPQLVAVKRLKAEHISTCHQDFEREIGIMKCLQHENIVAIKAVISEPEVSLVMEYIPHGSLQCYLNINKDRLRPMHLLKFALDVAKGMDYLGMKNIVHRDLAARNILVASDSRVKISDFGLAQVIGTNDYYILQTSRELPVKWYAPESIGNGRFSTRSDVWSFGVTLFEMFSLGEDPQLPSLKEHSTDQIKMLNALASGVRLPQPPTCPDTVYTTLIYPCWSHDSHSRPTFKAIIQTIQQISLSPL